MLPYKSIQKFLTNVALLATIISFSGFSNTHVRNEVPQIELVSKSHSSDYSTTKTYNFLSKCSKKVIYNQYISFNFESLLNTFNFNFYVRFKTQREVVLLFTDTNNSLKQNLIAKVITKDLPPFLIK